MAEDTLRRTHCSSTLPVQLAVEAWQTRGEKAIASPTILKKAEANWICPNNNTLGEKIVSEAHCGAHLAVAQLKGFAARNAIPQGTQHPPRRQGQGVQRG